MTFQETARKGYSELWTEFITATGRERIILAGSLDLLQPLCAPTPIEFHVWAYRSLPMYRQFWARYREQMLEKIDKMIEEGNEEVTREQDRLRDMIQGAEPGA